MIGKLTFVYYLKFFSHVVILGWLLFTYYLAIADQLGGDPVEAIIHFTGIGALHLLLITLCISPLAKYFKKPWLMKFRRMFGVYSFIYALCHIINFLLFEVQLDLALFFEELITRPYIVVGFIAFVFLFLLALTSFQRIQKKMKANWQKLHNWVYLISLFAVIHFYWSVKSEVIEPSLYFIFVLFLLYLRRRKLTKWFR